MKTIDSLLFTDTHLQPDTVEINRSIFKQAVDICLKKGITKIRHLGDVFDSRSSQTQEMLVVLDELLTSVTSAGISIDIIPGNHDKTSYESSDSFLHTYRFHPSVNIIREFYRDGDEDLGIYFLPFFNEKSGKYQEMVTPIIKEVEHNQNRKNILLTHIGINEAVMNGGSVIEDHIEGGLFSVFDKVYVGHFHDYQTLKKGKIVYIGSAYQENFGETSDKGFHILYSDGSTEFVKSIFPEYKKIVVDINSVTKEEMIELKKEHENSDDNIRFVFKGDKTKLITIDKGEFTSLGIDVKTEESDVDIIDYSEEATTFDTKSIKEEWEKFTSEDEQNKETGNKYLEQLN